MIQFIMLVILGFLIASLIALLLAPSLWRRAERLTTRRLEQTMPMSIGDIEADRDQLRASYAIMIRRLEAALNQEKMRSARQRVQISRLQMEIADLRERTGQIHARLDAEHNAAAVLQQTIAKRVPELDHALRETQRLLQVRDKEIATLANRLKRREEGLAAAQRISEMQQAEITRLRQSMEMSGAQASGRFKKRPSQWSIHDYRAEYDRLNVELSKLRERLSVAYDRETNQISTLKTELQRLAEQIISRAEEPASPLPASEEAEALQLTKPDEHADTTERPTIEERPIAAMLSAQGEPAEHGSRSAPWPRPLSNGRLAKGEEDKSETPTVVRATHAATSRMAPSRIAERAISAVASLSAVVSRAETSTDTPSEAPVELPAPAEGIGEQHDTEELAQQSAAGEAVSTDTAPPATEDVVTEEVAAEIPDTADLYRSAKSMTSTLSARVSEEASPEAITSTEEGKSDLVPAMADGAEPEDKRDKPSEEEGGPAGNSLLDRLRGIPESQSS